MKPKTEIAVLSGGCFWCTEAIFKRLKGVISVVPGYTGGKTENPTYDIVCSGNTGHTEAIRIGFDPEIISYGQILEIFWHTHDPASLNRQGNDTGTQYRSAIFYADDKQRETALASKKKLETEPVFKGKIVTQIVPLTEFYPAEGYHRDYYAKNSYAPYCQIVIDPKIQKLMKDYGDSGLIKT